jgi:hypothetical protein
MKINRNLIVIPAVAVDRTRERGAGVLSAHAQMKNDKIGSERPRNRARAVVGSASTAVIEFVSY